MATCFSHSSPLNGQVEDHETIHSVTPDDPNLLMMDDHEMTFDVTADEMISWQGTMTKEEQDFVSQEVLHHDGEIRECLHSLTTSPEKRLRCELMELCCEPDSLLVRTWEKLGGKGERLGLHNQCDLMTEAGTMEAIRLVREHKPKLLWASLPCGATSPLQNLNELTWEGWLKSCKRKQKSKRLVKNGIRVMEAQLCEGGKVVQEWPLHNYAWKFPSIIDFWDALRFMGRCEDIILDGCMFGLQDDKG